MKTYEPLRNALELNEKREIATIQKRALLKLETEEVWDIQKAYEFMKAGNEADTKRTVERRLNALQLLPAQLYEDGLLDEFQRPAHSIVTAWALAQARKRRDRVLMLQLAPLPSGKPCLYGNDARGARFWVPLPNTEAGTVWQALVALQHYIGKPIAIFPHGALVGIMRSYTPLDHVHFCHQAYLPALPAALKLPDLGQTDGQLPAHLKRLETESIYILREALAEARNPAMLYSIGKDSSVLLHLARKAFYPSAPPFPLLHVDTRWKFQEMYQFRDFMARESGMDLLVYINPTAIEKDINPFEHGSALHTEICKTEALKQALDKFGFDLVFGGARRDEETSRAKERIFSLRNANHRWDPKNQYPELWNLYNTRKGPGASLRVFPLSNWTELDVWQYIHAEKIPVVPLYFASPRPVVIRANTMTMVDDERCRLLPGEDVQIRSVRFRSLGCYPITGAVESNARTPEEVLLELASARQSERQGRTIDTDEANSMEKKKQEGYF